MRSKIQKDLLSDLWMQFFHHTHSRCWLEFRQLFDVPPNCAIFPPPGRGSRSTFVLKCLRPWHSITPGLQHRAWPTCDSDPHAVKATVHPFPLRFSYPHRIDPPPKQRRWSRLFSIILCKFSSMKHFRSLSHLLRWRFREKERESECWKRHASAATSSHFVTPLFGASHYPRPPSPFVCCGMLLIGRTTNTCVRWMAVGRFVVGFGAHVNTYGCWCV